MGQDFSMRFCTVFSGSSSAWPNHTGSPEPPVETSVAYLDSTGGKWYHLHSSPSHGMGYHLGMSGGRLASKVKT